MGIVKYSYSGDGFNKKFNVGQALKDGWNINWSGEDALIGLTLQDRKKEKHVVHINKVDWFMGIMRVWFKEGGWLCFDHAIEQFKCISK